MTKIKKQNTRRSRAWPRLGSGRVRPAAAWYFVLILDILDIYWMCLDIFLVYFLGGLGSNFDEATHEKLKKRTKKPNKIAKEPQKSQKNAKKTKKDKHNAQTAQKAKKTQFALTDDGYMATFEPVNSHLRSLLKEKIFMCC